jgi:hypothetical protein
MTAPMIPQAEEDAATAAYGPLMDAARAAAWRFEAVEERDKITAAVRAAEACLVVVAEARDHGHRAVAHVYELIAASYQDEVSVREQREQRRTSRLH